MLHRRLLGPAGLTSFLLFAAATPGVARQGIFTDLPTQALPAREAGLQLPIPRHFRALQLDVNGLENLLARAPLERSASATAAPLLLALPYPDGSDRLFRVEESPILEPALAAKFPDIHTFTVQGIDDPTASGRLSLTALGFHAMVMSAAGTVFVDPYRRWDRRFALSYWKGDARKTPGDDFRCEVTEGMAAAEGVGGERPLPPVSLPAATSGAQLRTYRLAVAATGEYSVAVCAPSPAAVSCAMAAIVISVNRVDGVYEREVAVRMVLIGNNNLIVYTDGTTDPYSNGNGSTMLGQNQTNINAVIGSANYDVGHVFSTGGGGIASLGVPCTTSKARGVTGRGSPIGDAFDIDYVAHEMGHQFGGNHTFNGTTGSCSGNRSSSAACEPGSGTTIMAYAGICGAEDLQPHSDDTFHTKSFDEIVAFSTGATGSSCAVTTTTGNLPPTVNAGASFTIPKQTPFTLTGSATDPDGDALTYMWEELDLGGTAAPPNDDVAASRPIFRSFVPLTVPTRTFPRLADILANVSTIGESLSTRNRTMTFRLMARDNRTGGGGVNYASTTVTVNAAAGPFVVTSPDTAVTWAGNSSQTVTWNVANTTAAPVSCANVAIALSTDGGNTFPTALAASTANDGSEVVTVPNTPTTSARIRVSCVGNIFFDIGNANFTIINGTGTPPPSLLSIAPTSGPIAGGTVITLTGTDFANGATVLFGAIAGTSVTVNSATSISATTPAGSAGAVSVTVTNPDTQSSTLNAAFTFLGPPTVTGVTPAVGPVAGGTAVTIAGTGFVNGATVRFGTTAATGVTVNSATSISATTPAAASPGAVTVTVTNPDTQSGSRVSGFTYQLAPSRFYTLAPCRIVDTRNADGPDGGPALAGGTVRTFPIAGQCGVPVDAKAVAINLTVILSSAAGDLRLYPSGLATPMTSTINFNAGAIRANNAIVGLDGPTAGSIDVMSDIAGGAHFLIDVTGYFR